MTITINNLLRVEPLNTAEFLTENHGLEHPVESITIMDVDYIDKWIKPNELLVAGDFFKTTINREFLNKIALHNCPGIISKEKFRKFISKDTIIAAEELQIPIILLPDRYTWSDIISPVLNEILRNKNQIIASYNLFNKVIVSSILNDYSIEGMCQHVSESLPQRSALAIVSKQGEIIDASSNLNWQEFTGNLDHLEKHQYIIPTNLNYQDGIQGWIFKDKKDNLLIAYPLTSNFSYMLLIYTAREINLHELLLQLEIFVLIIKLKGRLYQEIFQGAKRNNRFVLRNLINMEGNISGQNKFKLEMTLGRLLENNYLIALIKFDDSDILKNYYEEVRPDSFAHAFSRKFYEQEIIIFEEVDFIVVLIGQSAYDLRQEIIEDLLKATREYYKTSNFNIGISNCNSLEMISTSIYQAMSAYYYAKNGNKPYHFYSEMGFIKLLSDSNGDYKNPYYYELMQHYIIPILNYDEQNHTELYMTLCSFFSHHLSYKSTAEDLYIHVNTLRARLNRVLKILHMENKAYDDLLNLQIAIRIYQFSTHHTD